MEIAGKQLPERLRQHRNVRPVRVLLRATDRNHRIAQCQETLDFILAVIKLSYCSGLECLRSDSKGMLSRLGSQPFKTGLAERLKPK
jgi:hypothetical protein